ILPPLPVRYPEFAVWQLRRLIDLVQGQLAWWREHLAGVPFVLELPADRLRPAVPSLRGDRLRLPLGLDLEPALAALGRRRGATLFMTLLATFQALLHRYTLQEDFVVGSPVEGRGRLELEPLIGFFVNMLPLRASASEEMTFSDLLAGVRESVLSGFAHQDLPFDRVVEELAPQRDLSRTPLFQVAFALQEAMAGPDLPGVEVTAAAEVDTGVSRFDLTLLMERGPRGLDAIAEYSSDLFDRGTAQRMLGAFRVLVSEALAAPATPLAELPLLAEADREQVVFGWNRTAAEVPATPVHRLFELQAAAQPGALAVASAEEALTYGELERRANLLAWRLRRLGVGPEDLVALLLERSTYLVLGALGTLKAGGAYLPVDPSYPADRVLYILHDAGAKALLTTSRIVEGMPEVPLHMGRMILLDVYEESSDDGQSPPPADVDPDGLAYVIYTSGSTGKPKGTELHHRGLSNHVAWHGRLYNLTATDRASLIAGPGFDASVFEMWPPLVAGASLHVPPSDVLLSP
ncbi:MAG TPA: AMP-binding protein, partial [Solirubrobacterales bacterium]